MGESHKTSLGDIFFITLKKANKIIIKSIACLCIFMTTTISLLNSH